MINWNELLRQQVRAIDITHDCFPWTRYQDYVFRLTTLPFQHSRSILRETVKILASSYDEFSPNDGRSGIKNVIELVCREDLKLRDVFND